MQSAKSFSISQFLKSRTGLIILAFLTIAAYFLVIKHTAHVFSLLPYALLLLFPLLHLFMHGGHGGHGKQSNHADHNGHDEKVQPHG